RVIEQDILDLARDSGVKAGQWLVENEQLRLVQQAARERRLLLHAAREAFATLITMCPQVELFEQLLGAPLGALGVHAPEAGDEGQVLDRGELVVKERLVGNPGD